MKAADSIRTQWALATSEAEDQARANGETIGRLGDRVRALEAQLADAQANERELSQRLGEKTVLSSTLRGEFVHASENEVLYKGLAMRLKNVVDTGELSIVVRSGRMVLSLPNDVLFDSGSVELKPSGRRALGFVASALSTVPDRRFQIAGHTDNVPIQTARFPSNWELSTERAVQVVRFLSVEGGLKPTLLAAAGYGEFDPVATNDTTAGRARNRRIEIMLQPEVNEVVAVPDRY